MSYKDLPLSFRKKKAGQRKPIFGRGSRCIQKNRAPDKTEPAKNKDLPLSFGKKKAGQRKPIFGRSSGCIEKSRAPDKTEPAKNKDLLLSFGKKKAGQRKPVFGRSSRCIEKKPRARLVKSTNQRHFTQLYDVIAVGPLRQGVMWHEREAFLEAGQGKNHAAGRYESGMKKEIKKPRKRRSRVDLNSGRDSAYIMRLFVQRRARSWRPLFLALIDRPK